MGKKKASATFQLTPQSISAAKRGCQNPPFSSEEHRRFVLRANNILSAFGGLALGEMKSAVLTPFDNEELERILIQWKELSDGEAVVPDSVWADIANKLAPHWGTFLSHIALYQQLNLYRGLNLLDVFVRCNRTKEYYGMALASRALLELGVISNENLQFAYSLIPKADAVMENGRSGESVQFLEYIDLLLSEIEAGSQARIRRAIIGTRIGSSNLGDGKSNRGVGPTPLWQIPPFGDHYSRAPNVINAFQKRARRQRSNELDNVGDFSFKIYEILCDIVHPSFLGNSMLMEVTAVDDDGRVSIKARRTVTQNEDLDWIVAICIAGAVHGCSLIAELLEIVARMVNASVASEARQE